jgi:ABC-type amino acid transport substrate-binding protein
MQLRLLSLFTLMALIIIGSYIVFNMHNQRDTKTFVVGTTGGYAPFVSINERGEYEGFDIDVANALAAKLNKKLVLKDLGSMTSLIMALEQESIDAIIWGVSITQDRLKKFALIHYQGENIISNPLIFWEKIPTGVTGLATMKSLTVCVEPSSSQSAVLNKYNDINIMPTDKIDDALLNIQYGKADAALVDRAIAKKFKAKFAEIQILEVPLDEEDQTQGVGIAIKQNNSDLIDQVKRAVSELKSNGTINDLEKKWGVE